MGRTLTVQILNNKEFESLPYDGVSESNPNSENYSYGFADVKKGLAFVRNSGNKEFNLGTITHEVNHLIEKHGKDHPDYESGILHKKGGALRQIVPTLLAFVPGIGPVLSAASAVGMDQYAKSNHPEQLGQPGQIGDILSTAALAYGGAKLGQGAVGGAIKGGTAAAPGFLSKAGGILSGGVSGIGQAAGNLLAHPLDTSGNYLTGAGNASAIAALPSGTSALSSSVPSEASKAAISGINASSPLSVAPQSSLNLLGQVGAVNSINSTSVPAASGANTFSMPSLSQSGGQPQSLLGNASATPALNASTGAVITPTTGITGGEVAAKAPFSFKDLVTPGNVLGAGSLLGAMGQQTPQFQMPDSVEELRKKITEGQGLSPLGQQAQSELGTILKSTPQELYAPANDAYYAETNRTIDKQYAQAKQQLDAAYNNAGMLGSGEYMAELNKLIQAQANAKDSFAQTENQRRFELARTDKYRAIQDSLQVDKNTMDNLIGLTGMDVNMAASVYGVKASDVEQMRNLLGTAGIMAITNSQGSQSILNKPLLGA